jgi:hypothetical protein
MIFVEQNVLTESSFIQAQIICLVALCVLLFYCLALGFQLDQYELSESKDR